MKRRLRFWFLLLVLLAGLGQVFTATQPAWAHAILVRSLPEANAELMRPPTRVELWFSEPLEPNFSTVHLITSAGQEVLSGAVVFDPSDPTHMTLPVGNLDPGLYTVA